MRWVRFALPGGDPQLGVLVGTSVHVSTQADSLVELLREGTLTEAGELAVAQDVGVLPLGSVRLLAPIPRPPSIRDFMTFERHVDGVSRLAVGRSAVPDVWYTQPLFYFTNPAAVIGPYDDVAIPPTSTVFDFELEVAAVIGSVGGDLTLTEADDAIAGYLMINDWSARDLQFAEDSPLGPAKGKDSAITFGPWFVTKDELASRRCGDSYDLAMSVWVNDELIGGDRLDHMGWSFAEMAAYASRGTRLEPGDVLGSGTCAGGCLAELWGRHGRDHRPPLQPGDEVRMTVEGLGETRNRVVAGEPLRQPLAPRSRTKFD